MGCQGCAGDAVAVPRRWHIGQRDDSLLARPQAGWARPTVGQRVRSGRRRQRQRRQQHLGARRTGRKLRGQARCPRWWPSPQARRARAARVCGSAHGAHHSGRAGILARNTTRLGSGRTAWSRGAGRRHRDARHGGRERVREHVGVHQAMTSRQGRRRRHGRRAEGLAKPAGWQRWGHCSLAAQARRRRAGGHRAAWRARGQRRRRRMASAHSPMVVARRRWRRWTAAMGVVMGANGLHRRGAGVRGAIACLLFAAVAPHGRTCWGCRPRTSQRRRETVGPVGARQRKRNNRS